MKSENDTSSAAPARPLTFEEVALEIMYSLVEVDDKVSLEKARLALRPEDGLRVHLARSQGLAQLAALARSVLGKVEQLAAAEQEKEKPLVTEK